MDLAIVIPTRNRPAELTRLLGTLAAQSVQPMAVIVVDSSDDDGHKAQVREIVAASPLPIKLLDHTPPSAAAQRNHGLDEVRQAHRWVMLLDDDIEFAPDMLERLGGALATKGQDYIGFNLNPCEENAFRPYGWLRSLKLVEALGLYAASIGKVTRSGWQTRLSHVEQDTDVDWVATGAAVWKTSAIEALRFDEYFVAYSYLEDLDFGYRAGKLGRLAILADVPYVHGEATTAKRSLHSFGRVEVRNRFYFVKKHGLSLGRCRLAMAIRMLISLGGAMAGRREQSQRLRGNLTEIFQPGRS